MSDLLKFVTIGTGCIIALIVTIGMMASCGEKVQSTADQAITTCGHGNVAYVDETNNKFECKR